MKGLIPPEAGKGLIPRPLGRSMFLILRCLRRGSSFDQQRWVERSMRFETKICIVFIVGLFLSLESKNYAQEITVTGSWDVTIDETDLQGGAGSDLNSTYTSAVNQLDIQIKGKKLKSWRVDVSKADSNWHVLMELWIQRTGDGIGSGTIWGGTTYQEIMNVDQVFFYGGKNRKNIPIQLQLRGMTVQIPYDTYTTTIWFTVSEM